MIPLHNISGVLPPFSGASPTEKSEVSPYMCSISEFVERYSSTTDRFDILTGFLEYRTRLSQTGITDGIQWVDGSFLEKIEDTRGRPPADIDMVTIAHRPSHVKESDLWKEFIRNNTDLFDVSSLKSKFRCDAYFLDLDKKPELLVRDVSYWYGLVSHQRATFLWKGMVEIPLTSDDNQAQKMIEEASNA